MASETKNDPALDLKKRARRRLVGAIALVLLMIAILPMVLKDRTVPDAPKDDIKISMPDTAETVATSDQTAPNNSQTLPTPLPVPTDTAPVTELPLTNTDTLGAGTESLPTEHVEVITPEPKPEVNAAPVNPKSTEVKPASTTPAETPPADVKPASKGNENFTIQVGVYSDPANVAQLQAKLKGVGFSSRTEKVNTAKGEKIRLRVGKYGSRQEAADVLSKLNAAGLTGMVITY